MASAVPLYQFSSMRCCGGSTSMYSSSSRGKKPQPAPMWRDRLRALYWVSTRTRRRPLLMQLDSVKSTMRYRPPKGTAGLARSRVKGSSRVPLPPARIKVNTSRTSKVSKKTNHRVTENTAEDKEEGFGLFVCLFLMFFSVFSVTLWLGLLSSVVSRAHFGEASDAEMLAHA